jgi:hypothetical protein
MREGDRAIFEKLLSELLVVKSTRAQAPLYALV